MPDLKTITVAAPVDQVLGYFQSEDFKAKLGASVGGKLALKITPSANQQFNIWLGVFGEGSHVSVRGVSVDQGHTDLTFWFGINLIVVTTVVLLPLCGLGLLVGWLTYIKRKGTCSGLAARVENVLGQKFQVLPRGQEAGTA